MTSHTPQRQGRTIYVSALGDNSDGSTWAKAFNTIQSAFGAVPDDLGGHRVVIRPDTYMEGNLHPAHRGALGSYNSLEVDYDGSMGSGASGYAVVDVSDPNRGMQSVDWWGFPRCTPDFPGVTWDRWQLRHIYATGGDGGLFWDLPFTPEPFSIVVEDCVGIGRAFGGGVGHVLPRPDEPIVFKGCNLWSLDWWGDTAGAYVRVENETPQENPDVFFEDCTLVSPQCALKSGNPGFSTYTRVKLTDCRLAALNFSQPHGTPIDGVIQSVIHGKFFHVDLEDTTIIGYKVFGVREAPETADQIGYTSKGAVQAYVQYEQDTPEGIHPMGFWPTDQFGLLAPPKPVLNEKARHPRPMMSDGEIVHTHICELTPFNWEGRLCHMECVRPGMGGDKSEYYLRLVDAETDREFARFAEGYGLGSAVVSDGVFYAYASRYEDNNWNDVTLFWSDDLVNWETKIVIEQEGSEHIFNTSICESSDGFAMAYETNDPTYPAFTVKYALSDDLENWTKKPEAVFGTDRYTACPCIRYESGYYYQMYLEHRKPRWFFETYIARSKDLVTWEQSSMNPVLTPNVLGDGVNASDPEIVEFDGDTHVYYAVGDQHTWSNLKRTTYDGSMGAFFEKWFKAPAVPDSGTLAYERGEALSRRNWFVEAKFGLFIHWGLYSVHAKNDNHPYVSWAMEKEGISVDEYSEYAKKFDPQKFDPARWMQIAKKAGMKYVVFTSKHHEGFSIYESEHSSYTSEKTAAKSDMARQIVDAARDAGLKVGLYYSFLDWYHPLYDDDLDAYVTEFAHRQVEEICTLFGPIDVVWFDGEWDHPHQTWHAEELVRTIRRLQPGAVINDRLGAEERGKTPLADFFTREQPSEFSEKADFESTRSLWEACMTIGKSWGYRHDDGPWLDADELIRTLVDVACRGGNFLLNVGPTPDGEIPPHLIERLEGIGEWMSKNGESIYGTYGLTIADQKCTAKGASLYVHLEDRPSGDLVLTGLKNSIKRAFVLSTGEKLAVDDSVKSIALPNVLPDEAVKTIALDLDGDQVRA